MLKFTTSCCALCQIADVGNHTSKKEIQDAIDQLTKESKQHYVPGDDSGNGQKAVFIISTPTETVLRKNLKKLGFSEIHTFERRTGYPEGMLTMHIKNL